MRLRRKGLDNSGPRSAKRPLLNSRLRRHLHQERSTLPMESGDRPSTTIALRRAAAILAVAALAVGGAKVVSVSSASGSGFSTVQTAAADPTGPTGPGGGGMTGPPGGGSQFVPPSMPSMPDYQGGNQPPLDQNNGISIYNTGAQGVPQQSGQASSPQQGQNADGSWQRAANGEQQPIQYSTPPQYTGAQSIPNTAPQQSPQRGSQGSNNSQEGNQNQQQNQGPSHTRQPDTDDQQDSQIQRQCQLAAQQLGIPEDQFVTIPVGVGGSLARQPGRHWEAPLSCCGDDAQELPADQPKPSDQNQQCAPEQMRLKVDQLDDIDGWPDMLRTFNDGLTVAKEPLEALTGDPGGEIDPAPMRLAVTRGEDITNRVIRRLDEEDQWDVADTPEDLVPHTDKNRRIIVTSTIPGSGDLNSGLVIGQVTSGASGFANHGSILYQDTGSGQLQELVRLPAVVGDLNRTLISTTAYMTDRSTVTIVGAFGGQEHMWQVPIDDLKEGLFSLDRMSNYDKGTFVDQGLGQSTLTRVKLPDGELAWILYETNSQELQGGRRGMTTRIATGDVRNLLGKQRSAIEFPVNDIHGNPVDDTQGGKYPGGGRYYSADQAPIDSSGRLSVFTSRFEGPDYGITELRGSLQCP
ncbi:hypothetical protein D9R13_09890 [Mycobacteroides abscessus subsp. massiliense]|nr:hypothetical protein [Mycobacteroides abscessus]RRE02883.1 hypothetical protein D9R13_09890 [Mycobacteroides abscessus subsp. massiliense]